MQNTEFERVLKCLDLLKKNLYREDPDNTRGTSYRSLQFFEKLEYLLRTKFSNDDKSSSNDFFITLNELYSSLRPQEEMSPDQENDYIRRTIVSRVKSDQKNVIERLKKESLEMGLNHIAHIKSKQKDKTQYWGIELERIEPHECDESEAISENPTDNDVHLQINQNEIQYTEKPLGKFIGPSRWRCSKLKAAISLMILTIFIISFGTVALFLIIYDMANPFFLFLLYPFIACALILFSADRKSQFSGPIIAVRPGMKFPIIVNNAGLNEKYIDLQIKNIQGKCIECEKKNKDSKVFIQRHHFFNPLELEGRCAANSGHKYSFNADTMRGTIKT